MIKINSNEITKEQQELVEHEYKKAIKLALNTKIPKEVAESTIRNYPLGGLVSGSDRG